MPRWLTFAIVLGCAAVVGWVHVLPLRLHGVEGPAAQIARLQIQMRLAQEGGARLTPRELEAQTEQWIRSHPSDLAALQEKLSAQFKDGLRFTGEDGGSYTYLGDEDSYAWLRLARNILQHGTPCDEIKDGECRDTYVNAPLGAKLVYQRSLHVSAIALLHKLFTVFDPQHPLSATSFWVPVIVAVLGVWPAYWIGARLAGVTGGIGTALLTALHPYLLYRTIGSDNDIWNVVLPLYMNAAAIAACLAPTRRRQAAWALVAALFAALHAATWRGWSFTYVILMVALLGSAALMAAADWLRRRRPPPVATPARAERRRRGAPPAVAEGGRHEPGAAGNQRESGRLSKAEPPISRPVAHGSYVATVLFVALVYYIGAGIGVSIARPDESYWSLPLIVPVMVFQQEDATPDVREAGVWPNVMNTVSELQQSTFADLAGWGPYGRMYFLAALIGLLLALVPLRPPSATQIAVLLGGSAVFVAALLFGHFGAFAATLISAAPLLCAAWLRAVNGDPQQRDSLPALLMVSGWFLVGIFIAFRGTRYILLLTPGLGLAMGIGIGRVHQLIMQRLERLAAATRRATAVALGTLLCLLYLIPAAGGYAAARDYAPSMNDAWWDSLSLLRQRAAPDAIVNAWWDYGYWVKYVAERRITADGSMLLTHLPYWLGRVLVSGNERESAGLLRMLSCGSDATPLPEGAQGAYGLVQAKLKDAIRAHAVIIALAERSRADAAAYLQEQGFSEAERSAILARTHCKPPQTYVIIGTDLTRKDSWMRMAAWDFRRAYISYQAKHEPPATVVPDLQQRFGYSPAEAQTLYEEARRQHTSDFVIGPAPRAPSVWYPCQALPAAGMMRCPLGLFDLSTKTVIEGFDFNRAHPQDSVIRVHHAEPGHQPGVTVQQAPAALLVADQQLTEIDLTSARYEGAAILMDARNGRILIGPPQLIRSTFTHLLFLNGRYAQFYEKFDERVAYNEDRLQTWKVKFPED